MSRKAIATALVVLVVGAAAVLWLQSRTSPRPGRASADAAVPGRSLRQTQGPPDSAAIPRMLRDRSWQTRLAAANALRDLTALSVARKAGLLAEAIDKEATAPDSAPAVAGSYLPLTSFLLLQYLGLLEDLGPSAADTVRKADAPASGEGREWRALALAATDAPEVAPKLGELLSTSSDPAVRMTAARYLGYLKDRDAIPLLRRALDDGFRAAPLSDTPGLPHSPFYPVREQAAGALEAMGLEVERRGDSFIVQ